LFVGGKEIIKNIPKKINKQELDLFITWTSIWKEKINIKEFVSDLQTDGSLDNTVIEILDFEVSDLCFGPLINGIETPCSFCYKSNNKRGSYMSTENFKKVPKWLWELEMWINQIYLK